MRTAMVLVGLLVAGAVHLAACGLECGDGTTENDGECVTAASASAPLSDSEVAKKCNGVCEFAGGRGYDDCRERCSTMCSGVTPRICQNCLISSYAWGNRTVYQPSALLEAQDACMPLCGD